MTGILAQGNKAARLPYLTTIVALVLWCVGVLTACGTETPQAVPVNYELGRVTRGDDIYGEFYFYVPTRLDEKTEILVLVHGTPIDLGPANNAKFYVESWQDFADEHNYILIAPAFDQDNFSSRYGDHALSGYRGLFGREIGADEWVLRFVIARNWVRDMAAFAEANGEASKFQLEIIPGVGLTMIGLIPYSQKAILGE